MICQRSRRAHFSTWARALKSRPASAAERRTPAVRAKILCFLIRDGCNWRSGPTVCRGPGSGFIGGGCLDDMPDSGLRSELLIHARNRHFRDGRLVRRLRVRHGRALRRGARTGSKRFGEKSLGGHHHEAVVGRDFAGSERFDVKTRGSQAFGLLFRKTGNTGHIDEGGHKKTTLKPAAAIELPVSAIGFAA